MDDIDFTTEVLNNFPAHSALLGQIVTAFSLLEGAVGGIYGMLRHQTIEQGIEELSELSTNAKRVQAVRQTIKQTPLLSEDPSIDDLMKRVLVYSEKRNRIAHGVWGGSSSDTSTVCRVPVKKWINFLAKTVSVGTQGHFDAEIEDLQGFREFYSVVELRSLISEGEGLLREVMKLFLYLATVNAEDDGWIKEER